MALSATITALETRRDAIATELATFTSTSGEGPDFSIDGVSIQWNAHRKALHDELMQVLQTIEILKGPSITYTRGI